ncbi:MAG: 2-amino-4-hydroxy-6-hydroxymethyldihydropteridine diphosphokinase [Bacteroidales bacterium]|nr:2-amino-4-hydroxy-6-hydroxymethyldihydropteridine diphosphokinase [Candidatus Sodaliphilus aphodohippi]
MIYLNIGSNLGNREENLLRAIVLLSAGTGGCAVSSIVESDPWGFESGNKFLNVGVMLRCDMDPFDLLEFTQGIEKQMGSNTHRDANGNYVDRLVDIDIIEIDGVEINTPQLTVPHPRMHERDFVMKPLEQLKGKQ